MYRVFNTIYMWVNIQERFLDWSTGTAYFRKKSKYTLHMKYICKLSKTQSAIQY